MRTIAAVILGYALVGAVAMAQQPSYYVTPMVPGGLGPMIPGSGGGGPMIAVGGSGGSPAPPSTGNVLLVNGVDPLFEVDGSSNVCLAAGC